MSSRPDADAADAFRASETRAAPRVPRRWSPGGWRDVVFASAATLLVVHAPVDSLVASEPGTGPEQHLVRATATTALVALWGAG